MTKDKCGEVRVILNKILADNPELKALGVTVKVGKAGYSDTYCEFKISFNESTAEGDVITREAESFQVNAHLYGLKSSDLFRTYKHNGREYKIIGLNRGSKLIVKCEGQTYLAPSDAIAKLLYPESAKSESVKPEAVVGTSKPLSQILKEMRERRAAEATA